MVISKEQRAKWKSSVSALLKDPFGQQAFTDFLEDRKGEDDIINCVEFYERCESHKKLEENLELRDSAQDIHETYLDRLAEKEIPTGGQTRKVSEILESEDVSDETLKSIFDDSQEHVCKFISDGTAYKVFCTQLNRTNTSVCVILC
ncbi:unnamed protein product [Meganyctiphanes norvegica]|uniref:RGS domain-containing protein n=1 Tax=Meganyctiphanes norvegica TaxID=48144 RepID=A0AAV2QFQ6_MEGNR